MKEISDIESLENDFLWEVEVNASIAKLTKKFIMPHDIREISTLVLEQLNYITKSQLCFAGYSDTKSNEIIYTILDVDENDQLQIYKKKLSKSSHCGDMSKILENGKPLLVNKAKKKKGSMMILLTPNTVQRYIISPAFVEKEFVGLLGVVNSSQDYAERELIFVKHLAEFYALAIQRFRLDRIIFESNKNLEIRVQKRTEELSKSNKKLRSEIEARKFIQGQLKEAMKKAEVANRAKSEFVANMSHELRTPLNHIIGFSELILDKDIGDLNEIQEEYLKDVHQSSKHLLSLINDILDLSKVEAGKIELNPSQIDIRELLQNSLTMVKEKAFKHKIKLAINFDRIPNTIVGDERSLKQVMYNLLSNAVKFTPDKGSVSIMVHMLESDEEPYPTFLGNNGRYIKVSVSDTGIGIASDNLSRIFRPFEQIHSSLDRKYPGTGLGLSLTKKLIEKHSGKIWVESEGEGQGSTFHFIIPESI